MAARIVSPAGGPRPPNDDLAGKRGRIRKNKHLLPYGAVVFLWELECFFDSFLIHAGLHDTALGSHSDNVTQAAGSTSFVVFALAWPTGAKMAEKGKAQHHPGPSDQREHEGDSQRARLKSFEQPDRKPHSPSRPPLRLDLKNPLQDLLGAYTPPFDARPPTISTMSALRQAGSTPPSPGYLDDLPSDRLSSHLHKGEPLRPLGCDSHVRVNPFPLFSRMSSIGEGSSCGAPVETDFGGNETEDEFGAASVDDTAPSGLCPKSLRTLSLRRAPGEPFESGSAGGMVSAATESWKARIGRKVTASAAREFSRVVHKAQRAMRKKSPEVQTRPSEVFDEVDFPVRHDATTSPEGDRATSGFKRVPVVFEPSTVEALDEEPTPYENGGSRHLQPEATVESGSSDTSDEDKSDGQVDEFSLEALHNYKETRKLFKEQTEKYVAVANVYYGRNIVPFTLPSACAKDNIAALVTQVRSGTSLLYSTSLRELMHLVVRVLWRAVRLVAVCYPLYSYNLGRNESTVLKLPHFIRIFEESLNVVARDPGTSETMRQEQRDMAFKAQSAASQAEAALGAMESVVASGLTTAHSEVVDVLTVQDLMQEIRSLPTYTKRLLLMLAELCRSAYEMSEPEAQSVLCQGPPTGSAAGHEYDPVIEESIAYCRGEAQKFEQVVNNAQATAKKVAEHALTLYNKLMLVDLDSLPAGGTR